MSPPAWVSNTLIISHIDQNSANPTGSRETVLSREFYEKYKEQPGLEQFTPPGLKTPMRM